MSRQDVRRIVVAYDVPVDARRQRIAAVLQRYGDRIQYSVFVVDASPGRVVRLRRELEAMMAANEDSVLMCDLGERQSLRPGQFDYLGVRRRITDSTDMIV